MEMVMIIRAGSHDLILGGPWWIFQFRSWLILVDLFGADCLNRCLWFEVLVTVFFANPDPQIQRVLPPFGKLSRKFF